jgi:hypothetical protein
VSVTGESSIPRRGLPREVVPSVVRGLGLDLVVDGASRSCLLFQAKVRVCSFISADLRDGNWSA